MKDKRYNKHTYTAAEGRYSEMQYALCGRSGVVLPKLSLGLWHNFGSEDPFERGRKMIYHAFDRGITHFDLANNYGPVAGSAESNFGRILREGLMSYRDELFISSKAGHEMWSGPYGGNSSRKSIMASCDQSLKRTGLDYFDIFYSHRYDGITPIEETAQSLIDIVRAGKALYVGISKYPPHLAKELYNIFRESGTPCLLSQYKYSMFERAIEEEMLELAAESGSGFIAFSSLAQGMLSSRYLDGIPEGSRAAGGSQFLTPESITPERLATIKSLNEIAKGRGESLAQMALLWALRDSRMTSLIIGASSCEQIDENIAALNGEPFSEEQLSAIDKLTLL